MPLTDTDCRHAKKLERPYKLTDGEGMYLFIQPTGSKLWRIPAERMKMGREHLVPLTPEAMALLEDAAQERDGPYIFHGNRARTMSENTLLYAVYRCGFHNRQTVHGFRRLASTTLNEAHWPADHIERQLAHVEDNKIRGVYNAAEWMPARRKMMAWWSDFLEGRVKLPAA